MANAVSAVVVGAGGFGRHYARILSRRNAEAPAGVPKIRCLVLTRTDGAAAGAQARALRDDPLRAVDEAIPARARDVAELTALLDVHRPAYTCIAARDPASGDVVHVPYARAALNCCGVLSVENPLRKNIVAALRGEPVTGLDRTIASQRFLAAVYGPLSG